MEIETLRINSDLNLHFLNLQVALPNRGLWLSEAVNPKPSLGSQLSKVTMSNQGPSCSQQLPLLITCAFLSLFWSVCKNTNVRNEVKITKVVHACPSSQHPCNEAQMYMNTISFLTCQL